MFWNKKKAEEEKKQDHRLMLLEVGLKEVKEASKWGGFFALHPDSYCHPFLPHGITQNEAIQAILDHLQLDLKTIPGTAPKLALVPRKTAAEATEGEPK